MPILWVDPDLTQNKTGIGRDAQYVLENLEQRFHVRTLNWPQLWEMKPRVRRKIMTLIGLVSPRFLKVPSEYAAVRVRAIFLCDSISTKEELHRLYPDAELCTFVIPCHVPEVQSFCCGGCQGCQYLSDSLTKDYLVAVGTVEPRKNYPFLINFWKQGVKDDIPLPTLIIIGRKGWKSKRTIRRLKAADRQHLHWLFDCCDGALDSLYGGCSGLVSASLAEGFDLPAMEIRQRYGKPLILSDIPVHREFHGGVAYFFTDTADLLNILISAIHGTTPSDHDLKNDEQFELLEKMVKEID
jgi:glycosyltransferase involved in cell wall biosynthesis